MNTNAGEAKGGTAPGRRDTADNRQEMVTDIVRSLDRVHNGKLNGVQRLVNSPLSRVFTPRSLHGMALFNRLVTIDAVFSRCEQEVMRRANSMQAFDDKMGLERRMFELNAALVEFGAEMAIDYKVEEVPRDVAILAAMKRIKQETSGTAGTTASAAASAAEAAADGQTRGRRAGGGGGRPRTRE